MYTLYNIIIYTPDRYSARIKHCTGAVAVHILLSSSSCGCRIGSVAHPSSAAQTRSAAPSPPPDYFLTTFFIRCHKPLCVEFCLFVRICLFPQRILYDIIILHSERRPSRAQPLGLATLGRSAVVDQNERAGKSGILGPGRTDIGTHGAAHKAKVQKEHLRRRGRSFILFIFFTIPSESLENYFRPKLFL